MLVVHNFISIPNQAERYTDNRLTTLEVLKSFCNNIFFKIPCYSFFLTILKVTLCSLKKDLKREEGELFSSPTVFYSLNSML